MNTPEITLGCVANLWSRMMVFTDVGDTEPGHKHQFDHLTLLAHGSLKVSIDGVSSVFKAPHMIYIHADKNHELVALEANTVAYCIHAIRKPGTDDILAPDMIPGYTENPMTVPGTFIK